MKKFLSILLALAVGFTFTFGSAMSAFAAAPTADEQTKIANEAAKYTAEKFESAAKSYTNTLTIKDGKLIDTTTDNTDVDSATNLIDVAVVDKYVKLATEDAQTAFSTAIADLYDDDGTWTDVNIVSAVQSAYNTAISEKLSDSYVFANANVVKMLKEQLATEHTAAATAISKYSDTTVYSDKIDDWSIETSDTNDIGDPATYCTATITGKAANTVLTAKGYVDAILTVQTAAAKTIASEETVVAYISAINDVNNAAKIVNDVIGGHKITANENYYIVAVPTKADLAADTTVATAKTKAIDAIKVALNSKKAALAEALQTNIDGLNKYATLTAAQKAQLATYEDQKANLDANFANYESVVVAKINNSKTTTEVTEIKNDEINTNIPALTAEAASFALSNAKVEKVADLKADAEILAKQLDVNGSLYYDAEALADDLEEKIAEVYNATSVDAVKRISLSTSVAESSLIATKIDYIKFITGKVVSLQPKDSKGQIVSEPWKTVEAKATADAHEITAMKLGTNTTGFAADIADTDNLFDDAAIAELTALVDETTSAIEAATSITEVKTIFATAHDKYVAIKTVNDHHNAWEGVLGTAYTKAKYETDLEAYVTAAKIKANNFAKYPEAINTLAKVMDVVVYPIIYTAKTEAELADKVAEAKAAVDAMKTTEQVSAQKKEVETAISKIPASVTLADKDIIEAAKKAADEFAKVPGATTPLNAPVLTAAIKNYEALAAKELDDAYKALNSKSKLAASDAEAVNALRTLFDAHEAFVSDNEATSTATTTNNMVKIIEGKLLTAQIEAAKALMVAIVANPTTDAEKEAVKAARAAYDALSLEGKAVLANTPAYRSMIDAEEYIALTDKITDADAKAYVQDLAIAVRTVKSGKKVKVTVNADVQTLIDNGFTVEYKFYKSTKKSSGYKNTVNKTTNTYTNTNPVKGKNYYKVKLVVKNADGTVVATTPLTQCKYGVRTMK